MGESIKSRAHLLRFWVTFACTFFVYSCSHSIPTTDDTSDANKIEAESEITRTADFINPPISLSSTSTQLEKNNNIQQEKSIWQHIANNLALSKSYQHPNVSKQKQKFIADEKYLSSVSRKTEPFIHFVLEEIKKREMPAELAVLPIVESNYSPVARSHAKAAGLWQFMSYTATEYGLARTTGYDARYDVYASTHAALDFLSYLHQKFDGDWLLAMAAYNAGPQRVKRALKKHSKDTNNTDGESKFWQLSLPRETRQYVPKILALSAIIQDEKLSSTLLHPVANKPYVASLEVNKRITISALAKVTGIATKELLKLNPALKTAHSPSPESYHLLTPNNTKELVAVSVFNLNDEPVPVWQKHEITYGDSLSKIANHYGTSIKALRETNNLYNNQIIVGDELVIPPSSFETISAKVQTSKTPRRKIEKKKVLKQRNTSDLPYFYVVTAGDSFWEIASRNNTTVRRLSQINDRHPDQPLRPGESILID